MAKKKRKPDANRDPLSNEPGAHPIGVGVGATGGSVTASSLGEYRCRVTAQNEAGSASQTSAASTATVGKRPGKPYAAPSITEAST